MSSPQAAASSAASQPAGPTLGQWIEGARPRTLPAAISPVLAGTGAAVHLNGFSWWRAVLCLGVSLWLQIGVNYANDYSDGVKGTDADRVGPLRLVGSGIAKPGAVKRAAFVSFAIAAVLGLVLAITSAWWLIGIGIAAIPAAWGYTGGKNPYGYRGLGEISVFVFFGLIAVLGTCYAQARRIDLTAALVAIGVGTLACAILVVNNLRDIPTDTVANKRTLAVRLGDRATRALFHGLFVAAAACGVIAAARTPWAWLFAIFLPLAARATVPVAHKATGRALIGPLRDTGLAELAYSAALFFGFLIAHLSR